MTSYAFSFWIHHLRPLHLLCVVFVFYSVVFAGSLLSSTQQSWKILPKICSGHTHTLLWIITLLTLIGKYDDMNSCSQNVLDRGMCDKYTTGTEFMSVQIPVLSENIKKDFKQLFCWSGYHSTKFERLYRCVHWGGGSLFGELWPDELAAATCF